MYKKAYLEITNVCNLNCSFCHKTSREKRFMTESEFRILTDKIRPFTEYLYLHLMGEPLLHPSLGKLLAVAAEKGFKVTVATNGLLINEKAEELSAHPPYKITFSLHSYEANCLKIPLREYLYNITEFCKKAEKLGTICVLRLWNGGGESSLNGEITDFLKEIFNFRENRRGYTLSDRIYLEFADAFVWPDINAPGQDVHFCMGLRDHFGVLSDGSVVPCCLDADGEITLGNLFTGDLQSILSCERAENIRRGFSEHRCSEELCSRCGYAVRFG